MLYVSFISGYKYKKYTIVYDNMLSDILVLQATNTGYVNILKLGFFSLILFDLQYTSRYNEEKDFTVSCHYIYPSFKFYDEHICNQIF